jgi:acyl-CoA thioesterase II
VTHALDDVLACLVMREEGSGRYAADSVEIVTKRIYGGQVLAQILVAAATAVPAKQVKSVYVQFARDGVAPDPVHIDVAVLHEGGTYATCDVRVSQDERVIADATVSLHVPGEGPAQQWAELLDHDPEGAAPQVLGMIPCETRVVGDVNLREETLGPAEFAFWMRAAELDAPLAVHQALVAYASDLTPISTALRAIPGMSQLDSHRTVQTATTSHTIWFHHDLDLTGWLCLQQWSPVTGEGRSFGMGHVFDRSGACVATYAQDAMVRYLRDNPGQVARTTA